MLKILIKRNSYESGAGYSLGRLFTDEGGFLCWILEDEDRGLTQDMPLSKIQAIKVYGETAIPKGTYKIELRVSPTLKDRYYAKKYGGMFPYLVNVPGYEGMMIHPGNTVKDTRGCLLPGTLKNNIRSRVFESAKAYYDLMDFYIWPAYQRNDEIWLTIE